MYASMYPIRRGDDLVTQIGDSVRLIDLRPEYARLWQEQRLMPRGFHNGQPYSGHLNQEGQRRDRSSNR